MLTKLSPEAQELQMCQCPSRAVDKQCFVQDLVIPTLDPFNIGIFLNKQTKKKTEETVVSAL